MKNRNDLAEYLATIGNKGAEIGVGTGTYSEVLCLANPKLELWCVDSWEGKRRTLHRNHAVTRLEPFNTHLIQLYSMEALQLFKNESLDFVYIDADHHFDAVMLDIIHWGQMVRTGGVIAGHDYGNGKGNGVKDAVNMYVKWHGLELHVLPEPDIRWTPRNPSDEIAGLTWWFTK